MTDHEQATEPCQPGCVCQCETCRANRANTIRVGPFHPAWDALDDDDWNGATFSTWACGIRGMTVILEPAPQNDHNTLRMMAACLAAGAKVLRVGER